MKAGNKNMQLKNFRSLLTSSVLSVAVLVLFNGNAMAALDEPVVVEEGATTQEAAVATVTQDETTSSSTSDSFPILREAIAKRLPDVTVTSLEQTQVDGMYELISQGKIYYISEDARFIFDGMLIDLETRQNLTNERLSGIHIGLINAMDESQMLVYDAQGEADRSITVFTDTSCGYCRKLHAELDTLLDSGVSVRYLMFPRAGEGSPSHKELESIWCADDPQAAMTTAKSGGSVAPASCENPIVNHMALAEQVGLRGTPLIYLDTGQQVPGYRAAAELVEMVKAGTPVE